MISFALFAGIVLSQKPAAQDFNVWFCPHIEVTDHSALDRSPGPAAYDARDAFGGTYGNVAHEGGHIVFEDDDGGAGQPDFIEWTTKDPVSIHRLLVSWQDDTPGNNWRNLARFVISARRTSADAWKVIWQENTPSRVGRYTMTKEIPAETGQLFRIEFIRSGATNGTASAPRICEIEAYGTVAKP